MPEVDLQLYGGKKKATLKTSMETFYLPNVSAPRQTSPSSGIQKHVSVFSDFRFI